MNKVQFYRIWHTIRLCMIFGSDKRAEYIRKHHIFHSVGEGCTVIERKVPLCSQLISLGNNVHLASKVSLISHDAIHLMLNKSYIFSGGDFYHENIGCIEIGDNVFVGANTIILPDVRIGSNVVIAAGAVVNKDIPDNSVAAGVPARIIGKFDILATKRLQSRYPDELAPKGHNITSELEKWMWDKFSEIHY